MKSWKFALGGALATALLIASAPASASNLVVNGSFEADTFNTGGGFELGLVGNGVTGWFIPASDGTYPWGLQNGNSFGAGPAADGDQWIVLGETGQGGPSTVDYTIQQTINGLTAGNVYTLSFALSSELGAGGAATGEVSFLDGSSFAPTIFTAPPRGSTFWSPWQQFTTTFVATAASATLQFRDLAVENNSGGDLGIDNVSVTGAGVPEPAGWAMMLVGFFGLGALLRRREERAVTTV
jgi:hypothetical protein